MIDTPTKYVYYISDIVTILNVPYYTIWTKIKSTEETKHLIQKGKRKSIYSRSEFELIVNHCFTAK